MNITRTFAYADTAHLEGTKTVTASTALTGYDTDVLVDATSGSLTITLPTPIRGKVFSIKKTDSTQNTITISHATATVDGQSSYLLRNQYESVRLSSDGTNYFVHTGTTDRDSVRTIISTQTLTNADDIVLVDSASGVVSVTLPAPLVGKKITIKKINSGPNPVTIFTPSGTLDGLASKSLIFFNDFAEIVSDGTNYYVKSSSPVVVSSEAQLSAALSAYSATGGIIYLGGSFPIGGSYTVPSNVVLAGSGPANTITLTGTSELTLGTDSEIRDFNIATTKTSGVLVQASGNRSIAMKMTFTVSSALSLTCVRVTGSGNRIAFSRFIGATGSATGISFVSGTQNYETNNVFF